MHGRGPCVDPPSEEPAGAVSDVSAHLLPTRAVTDPGDARAARGGVADELLLFLMLP